MAKKPATVYTVTGVFRLEDWVKTKLLMKYCKKKLEKPFNPFLHF
jgi:hypothetical protein